MRVTIVGSGYVGLVTGACLADVGNDVLCLDVDAAKIQMLKDGGVPIHEPGLEQVIKRNVAAQRLAFTTDAAAAMAHGQLVFIGVGTPPAEDGSADLQHVLAVARTIGQHMTDYKVVVDKSTVPVGTSERVQAAVAAELKKRGVDIPFAVVSNPEFLKEGAAIADFMKPDRVVVGGDDERAIELMRAVYAPFTHNRDRILVMDARSAEFTKYAANAMLATRISFMNELSRLADKAGADIEAVRRGIGSDPRIGTQFLYAGPGYGGSCFPKDVRALIRTGQDYQEPLALLQAVHEVNESQKQVLVKKVRARFGDSLAGRRFAVWGLAFKPETDDMREAPAQVVIQALHELGATVSAYDPVATDTAKKLMPEGPAMRYASRAMAALEGADALIIMTEWREFKSPDFERIARTLKQPVVFDGRNLYEPALARSFGLEYHGIGRGGARP
ncbi:nucleotide sugar dehydrogenase [Burkholderiales bacterium JOSHI_001]|nr:nucleotide sugar dehydrogenase [Burkholderiales bacterium JOSHI_001]